jgi:hypothetical protein
VLMAETFFFTDLDLFGWRENKGEMTEMRERVKAISSSPLNLFLFYLYIYTIQQLSIYFFK